MQVKVITEKVIDGDLIFDGRVVFEDDATITGKLKVTILVAKRDVDVGRNMSVEKSMIVGGHVEAGGIISVGENVDIGKSIIAEGNVSVGRNIDVGGNISVGRNIEAGGIISVGGNISAGRNIDVGGNVSVGRNIDVGGNISVGGNVSVGGDIRFSYFLQAEKVSCRLLRISTNSISERQYWIEKFNLFGFKNLVKEIENICVDKIRDEIEKNKKEWEKLLDCLYFTKIERVVLKSWIDGKLEDEKV